MGEHNGSTRITFGKHKGKPVSEVEASYFEWLVENAQKDWVIAFAKKELARRNASQAGDNIGPQHFNDGSKPWVDAIARLNELPSEVKDFEKHWAPKQNRIEFINDLCDLFENFILNNGEGATVL